jgi:hypothetical protein
MPVRSLRTPGGVATVLWTSQWAYVLERSSGGILPVTMASVAESGGGPQYQKPLWPEYTGGRRKTVGRAEQFEGAGLLIGLGQHDRVVALGSRDGGHSLTDGVDEAGPSHLVGQVWIHPGCDRVQLRTDRGERKGQGRRVHQREDHQRNGQHPPPHPDADPVEHRTRAGRQQGWIERRRIVGLASRDQKKDNEDQKPGGEPAVDRSPFPDAEQDSETTIKTMQTTGPTASSVAGLSASISSMSLFGSCVRAASWWRARSRMASARSSCSRVLRWWSTAAVGDFALLARPGQTRRSDSDIQARYHGFGVILWHGSRCGCSRD